MEVGRIHSSGGIGWFPDHSYTPRTDNQNLPQDGHPPAPPSFHSVSRAFWLNGSEDDTPSKRRAT